ncbi:hypothetical protein, partial [uncultured Chloroflexus sp.]
ATVPATSLLAATRDPVTCAAVTPRGHLGSDAFPVVVTPRGDQRPVVFTTAAITRNTARQLSSLLLTDSTRLS